jgi:hypothetical protein
VVNTIQGPIPLTGVGSCEGVTGTRSCVGVTMGMDEVEIGAKPVADNMSESMSLSSD